MPDFLDVDFIPLCPVVFSSYGKGVTRFSFVALFTLQDFLRDLFGADLM